MTTFSVALEGVEQSIARVEQFGEGLRRSVEKTVAAISHNARDMVRHALRAEGYTTIANDTEIRTIIDGYEIFVQGEAAKRLNFLLNGTRPHTITARRGQALRFAWGGGIHFYRSVNHPGTRPNNVLQNVFFDIRSMAEQEAMAINLEG